MFPVNEFDRVTNNEFIKGIDNLNKGISNGHQFKINAEGKLDMNEKSGFFASLLRNIIGISKKEKQEYQALQTKFKQLAEHSVKILNSRDNSVTDKEKELLVSTLTSVKAKISKIKAFNFKDSVTQINGLIETPKMTIATFNQRLENVMSKFKDFYDRVTQENKRNIFNHAYVSFKLEDFISPKIDTDTISTDKFIKLNNWLDNLENKWEKLNKVKDGNAIAYDRDVMEFVKELRMKPKI